MQAEQFRDEKHIAQQAMAMQDARDAQRETFLADQQQRIAKMQEFGAVAIQETDQRSIDDKRRAEVRGQRGRREQGCCERCSRSVA